MNISSFPFPWLLLHPQGACLQPARRCHRGAKSLCTLPWSSMCLCSGWSRAAGISPRSIPWGYGQATHQGTGNRTTKSTQTPCRLAKASCYKPQLTSWESFPELFDPIINCSCCPIPDGLCPERNRAEQLLLCRREMSIDVHTTSTGQCKFASEHTKQLTFTLKFL